MADQPKSVEMGSLDIGGTSNEFEATEILLERFGRRQAVLARGAGGLIAATIAPWVDSPLSRSGALVISAGLLAWTAAVVVRTWRTPVRLLTIADATLVTAIAIAVPFVDSAALVADHNGWVIVAVTTLIVSVHWHQPPLVAWGVSITLASAYFIGGANATTPATIAHTAAWLVIGSALSALAWGLVTREGSYGRRADCTRVGGYARCGRRSRTPS